MTKFCVGLTLLGSGELGSYLNSIFFLEGRFTVAVRHVGQAILGLLVLDLATTWPLFPLRHRGTPGIDAVCLLCPRCASSVNACFRDPGGVAVRSYFVSALQGREFTLAFWAPGTSFVGVAFLGLVIGRFCPWLWSAEWLIVGHPPRMCPAAGFADDQRLMLSTKNAFRAIIIPQVLLVRKVRPGLLITSAVISPPSIWRERSGDGRLPILWYAVPFICVRRS